MLTLLLAGLFLCNAFLVARDLKQYRQFKTAECTETRQDFLRQWVIEPFLFYGVGALIILGVLGQWSTLLVFPEQLEIASTHLRELGNQDGFLGGFLQVFSWGLVAMLLVGNTIITAITVIQNHRQANEPIDQHNARPSGTRDIEALLPRNKGERFWTALLSINAGFSEELFFRLMLPILLGAVIGNVWVAIVFSIAWFGLVHMYQGWVGILATSFVGILLMLIYLQIQQLWLVIVLHMVVDLNSMWFAPWLSDHLTSE